jgi:hypothetical protein
LLWTRRGYSWWMTALGAGIALVVRANGLQIARAVRKPKPAEATAGGAVVPTAVDGPTDMVGVAGGRG